MEIAKWWLKYALQYNIISFLANYFVEKINPSKFAEN